MGNSNNKEAKTIKELIKEPLAKHQKTYLINKWTLDILKAQLPDSVLLMIIEYTMIIPSQLNIPFNENNKTKHILCSHSDLFEMGICKNNLDENLFFNDPFIDDADYKSLKYKITRQNKNDFLFEIKVNVFGFAVGAPWGGTQISFSKYLQSHLDGYTEIKLYNEIILNLEPFIVYLYNQFKNI
eukprot:467945_1